MLADRNKVAAADDSMANERSRLQAELRDLLSRLAARPPSAPVAPPPKKSTTVAPPLDGKPIDAIREGVNYFRDNDFEFAARVFGRIDLNTVTRDDRAFVQYMRACSLRRMNRINDAAAIYREIADAHDDDFLTECAIWQLSMIRESQELETQLVQLRVRTK